MNNNHSQTRVTARVSVSVKEKLQKAAQLSGSTLNQFMIQAALKEAQIILENEQIIYLSQQDADTVFNLIENPPPPNENLKAAIKKHKNFYHEEHTNS